MEPLKLPNVSSKYGAPMGRRDTRSNPDYPGPFRLQRLRWVDGDYDEGGAYWGRSNGDFIYWATAEGYDEPQEIFVRATSRAAAKAAVREVFYDAHFYN